MGRVLSLPNRHASRLLAAALLASLAACTVAPVEVDHSETSWLRTACADGVHTVMWRSFADGAVPRNRNFDMDVEVRANGVLRSVGDLAVRGWMPDHNHGLVQLPSVQEVGAGRYRVEGMLLHMRGRWEVRFSFIDGGEPETITFEVEL